MDETVLPTMVETSGEPPLEQAVSGRYAELSPVRGAAGMLARAERLCLFGMERSSLASEILGRWGRRPESGLESLPYVRGISRSAAAAEAAWPAGDNPEESGCPVGDARPVRLPRARTAGETSARARGETAAPGAPVFESPLGSSKAGFNPSRAASQATGQHGYFAGARTAASRPVAAPAFSDSAPPAERSPLAQQPSGDTLSFAGDRTAKADLPLNKPAPGAGSRGIVATSPATVSRASKEELPLAGPAAVSPRPVARPPVGSRGFEAEADGKVIGGAGAGQMPAMPEVRAIFMATSSSRQQIKRGSHPILLRKLPSAGEGAAGVTGMPASPAAIGPSRVGRPVEGIGFPLGVRRSGDTAEEPAGIDLPLPPASAREVRSGKAAVSMAGQMADLRGDGDLLLLRSVGRSTESGRQASGRPGENAGLHSAWLTGSDAPMPLAVARSPVVGQSPGVLSRSISGGAMDSSAGGSTDDRGMDASSTVTSSEAEQQQASGTAGLPLAPGRGEAPPAPGLSRDDLEQVAEQVYTIIEQRLTVEKERRGL